MAFATSNSNARWTDGIIPYEISDDFDQDQRDTIRDAIRHWNEKTIIRLIPHGQLPSAMDFVEFVPAEDSCQSFVGRIGGRQTIGCDVGDGFSVGSVIHEIGHAVGYMHEQQRPDRDLFVTINEDNILPDFLSQFDIRTNGMVLGPYDYGSIMHYPEWAFTNGNGDTIVPNGGEDIGQREGLSPFDIKGVCVLYNAPHVAVAWQDDQNENGLSNIMWSGLTRWGKRCGESVVVHQVRARDQARPAIGMDSEQNSYVVWEDNRTGSYRIRVRSINVVASDRIVDAQVSTSASGDHRSPSIAVSDNGAFMVTWQERQAGGNRIRARGVSAGGVEVISEFTVTNGERGIPAVPSIVMASDRNFFIVWAELTGEVLSVHARGYRPNGTPLFDPIVVADGLGDQDVWPRVATSRLGNFYVSWEDRVRDVKMRGFSRSGNPLFGEIDVTNGADGQQLLSDITVTDRNEVMVVWTDDRNENNLFQIRASTFDLDGNVIRRPFTINQRGGGHQQRPGIAANMIGHYYIAWEDDQHRDGTYQVHMIGNHGQHTQFMGTTTVNEIWRGQQTRPAVATRG